MGEGEWAQGLYFCCYARLAFIKYNMQTSGGLFCNYKKIGHWFKTCPKPLNVQ